MYALECEWHGYHADRQYSGLPRSSSYNRRGARSSAAPHARGHETHMHPGQMVHDFVDRFFGRRLSDLGE
ncbi:hypothetical protein D3C71_1607160 [compost metagenome]